MPHSKAIFPVDERWVHSVNSETGLSRMLDTIEQLPRSANPLRVGIIGISGYGRILLQSLRHVLDSSSLGEVAAATVTGSCGEEETIAELRSNNTGIYSDYREMYLANQGRLDLCVIPTGIHWHARMGVDALRIGGNILVEKPITGSVEDALWLIKTARECNRVLAVGFQDMYCRETHEIRDLITTGKLGRLRKITAIGSWKRGEAYYKRNEWAGRLTCDGWSVRDSPLNNAFAHFANLALFFAVAPGGHRLEITGCEGNLLRFFPIESFDSACVSWWTRDGARITCAFTHADEQDAAPRIEIELEAGSILWQFEDVAIAYTSSGHEITRWRVPTAEEARRRMLLNVVRHLKKEEALLCPPEIALNHVRAIEMVADLPIQEMSALSWQPQRGLLRRLLAGSI